MLAVFAISITEKEETIKYDAEFTPPMIVIELLH